MQPLLQQPIQQQQINDLQTLYNHIPKQIITHLTTKLPQQYSLQSNLQQIDLPTSMDQMELNQLLKNLLGTSSFNQQSSQSPSINPLNVHYEFLIGKKLLRGQLKSHLLRYDISCEQIVEVQYILGFQELNQEKNLSQTNQWIEVLQLLENPIGNGFLCGLWNGTVELYTTNNRSTEVPQKLSIFQQVDADSIKALKLIPILKENQYLMLCGGLNETLQMGKITIDVSNGGSTMKKATYQTLKAAQFNGGSIYAIDINPIDDGHFAIAGQSGQLNVYKANDNLLQTGEVDNENLSENPSSSSSKHPHKKLHLSEPSSSNAYKLITFQPIHPLEQSSILCLNWHTPTHILTGSTDHTIKLTSVEKMKTQQTFLTRDSITTSISSYDVNSILTSHQDGYVRLWDMRQSNRGASMSMSTPSSTFKGHSKYVSKVVVNDVTGISTGVRNNLSNSRSHNDHIFATSSYDTSIKIWDLRSIFPLQNITTHSDKIFDCIWHSGEELVSGGVNGQLCWNGVRKTESQ